MTHASLFTGIGGFDLAASWMGWENVFQVEIDPFCQQILKYHFPHAQRFTDIRQFDGRPFSGAIDVLSGGFPCQPYSTAGKRKGKDDDRHLWPEMLRVIQEVSPRWVVGENVRGLVSWNGGLVFEEVQADLEATGYEVQPFILPAAGVGAPHRRDRVWFVAHAAGIRCERHFPTREGVQRSEQACGEAGAGSAKVGAVTHTGCVAGNWRKSDESENCFDNRQDSRREEEADFTERLCEKELTAHTDCQQRYQGRVYAAGPEAAERYTSACGACASGNWENFPTQPPLRWRNDGISARLDGITFSKWRTESLKGYGNAVLPQVVYQIFKVIEQYEGVTTIPG